MSDQRPDFSLPPIAVDAGNFAAKYVLGRVLVYVMAGLAILIYLCGWWTLPILAVLLIVIFSNSRPTDLDLAEKWFNKNFPGKWTVVQRRLFKHVNDDHMDLVVDRWLNEFQEDPKKAKVYWAAQLAVWEEEDRATNPMGWKITSPSGNQY